MCTHRRRRRKRLSRADSCGPELQRKLQRARVRMELRGARGARPGGHAGARPPGSNLTCQMAVTLSERRRDRPDRGPVAAPQAHGEVRHRRRRAAVRHDGAGREQERRAADPRLQRPHRRARCVVRNVPAHPRRRRDARDPPRRSASTSPGAARTRSRCAPRTSTSVEIDRELAELIRASFLLAGPLLARFHRAVMPPPGGDVIGRRRLDPHLDAFRAMGADRRLRRRDRAQRAQAACARPTCSWTSPR